MKLLWILPYTPTPIRTRPYYLLRGLLERGHTLTLATIWENDSEQEQLVKLEDQGVRVLSEQLTKRRALVNMMGAFLKGIPLQSRYSWSEALAGRVKVLLCTEEFDAIHVEHLRGAAYGQLARRVLESRKQAKPVVWDSVDCISLLFEQARRSSRGFFGRWVTRFELPRTRRTECWLVRSFDTTLVTSAKDKVGFERLTGQRLPQLVVLPNGVDMDYFCPDETRKAEAEIVFSGKLSYHANLTAALHLVRQVMPYVWEERSEVNVVLAGKDPPRELLKLGEADRRVIVTGTVDDLRPYLRRATVAAALVPYGAGIQNKVLEAMACGTPVVGSPQAAAALKVIPGRDMLVVDGDRAQACALLKVIEDGNLRTQLSTSGRCYVEEQHDWYKIAGRLDGIYRVQYGCN